VDQATLERYREVKINFEANMIPDYPVAEWELLEEKAVSYYVLKCRGIRLRRKVSIRDTAAGKPLFPVFFVAS
jgi:hypothetical protein